MIKTAIISLLLCISLCFVQYSLPYLDNSIHIYFIDVGQGDCTVIKINNSKKAIMIDSGGNLYSDIIFSKIIPFLKQKGIEMIDTLILTHGDYDHMGASLSLIENFKVENVVFNLGEYNELELELIKLLEIKDIEYSKAYECVQVNDIRLEFLLTKEYDEENDNSIVIYSNINGLRMLLMGDAGIEVEEKLIEKYNLQSVDLLKVGHHGSKTSSSKIFIDSVSPKYAIISVGENNRYGHPSDSVMENLNVSKVYRTDMDGNIMFKIKKGKLEIKTGVI